MKTILEKVKKFINDEGLLQAKDSCLIALSGGADSVALLKINDLEAKIEAEKARSEELNKLKIYVQTKDYIEDVAKEKLGLVNPDELILKPDK